jgi:hypothetical protein
MWKGYGDEIPKPIHVRLENGYLNGYEPDLLRGD